jgi:hypothetical protein
MRTVGAVVIRLEPSAGQQLRVRDQKVQPAAPCHVLHPQDAVLVFIESGHQNPLKARHQLFPLAGGKSASANDRTPEVYFLT